MIRVELPWPDKRLSPNARVHWRQKADATKTARQAAFVLGRAAGLKRVSTVPIGMDWTFCPPDRLHRDRDNAIASAKALADGLADALGVDDRHFVPTYRMGDPVKGGAVIVLVEVGP